MWFKKDEKTTLRDVFLRNINASSLDDVNAWFTKSYKNGYFLDCIKEAVTTALSFKEKPVTIVGDYDADGVTSTSILTLALRWCGFKNIRYRIPKRFSEGFGINPTIIDEINEGLVITCDNGVAQVEAIQQAKDKGLTVIILDHHEPAVVDGSVVLPPADVIVDANAGTKADYHGYCGAGVCLKFAREMFFQIGLSDKLYIKLIGLAAIGTVADVMELREENYVFVKNGLKYLLNENFNTFGTNALVKACGCDKVLTSHDVGFKLGPVINASSRMNDDGAKNVVELLTYEGRDMAVAVSKAEKLCALNDVRKGAKREGMEKARKIIEENCMYGDIPLVVNVPDAKEGIIGILAGSLCEEYKVPAIVVTETEPGILKGSARSCGNCNIKEELDKVSSLLLRYGGHACAAGLSLKTDNLEEFRTVLCNNIAENGFEMEVSDDTYYDIEIDASEIPDTIEALKKYEPFGEGNSPIVFKVNGFDVVPRGSAYKSFIGDGSIVKLYGANATAIGFNMAERLKGYDKPKKLEFVGVLSENYFNGTTTNQVEFTACRVVDVERVETPLAARLKSMALTSGAMKMDTFYRDASVTEAPVRTFD